MLCLIFLDFSLPGKNWQIFDLTSSVSSAAENEVQLFTFLFTHSIDVDPKSNKKKLIKQNCQKFW